MNITDTKYVPEIQEVLSSGRVLNVLVVDDSKVVRAAIREILELGNIQVTEACDGKEALDIIYNNVPDLVLLDVVMPGIDGIAVLKVLRETYSKIQLPIVLVTSKGSSNEIVQSLDYGANDYVTKPIDFDVLWARLSNQLMQKQAAEYLRSAQISLDKQIKQRTTELHDSNNDLKKEIEVRLLAESQLQYQANYDELTGLPNRSLATDRLHQTLFKSKRHNLQPCLAFLDLDNFKYINDTFGHAAGDELLQEVSKRLSDCARESDTVARLGGDEFLLILEDDNANDVQRREISIRQIGERILKSFSRPFVLDGHELNVTPSLGFAVYPKDGEDSDTLMRHADVAMYRSKHDGKNTYCFYSSDMTVKAKIRMDVELELRHALERDEFSVHYQPIIDSRNGRIVKAEALLRWDCEKLGTIAPEYFIPIAEETGLIVQVGDWVIKTACKQVKKWRELGRRDICVCINISARQLQTNSALVETIRKYLNEYELTPDAIHIELTEGVLMKGKGGVDETIKQLEMIGIKMMIDDFGTGYASMSCLQRYNFDSIKIDRSFISNITVSKQDEKMIRAVISMAKSLGMTVISEGVENKKQHEFLMKQNCEYVQGHLYSQPVQADEFMTLFNRKNEINIVDKSTELTSAIA